MADIKKLAPKILKWEGGFVNDPVDQGGVTNKGITLITFRDVFGQDKTVDDLKNISDDAWMKVLKKFYWDRWKADEIENQSVANILVDWVWGSGKWGVIIPQRVLDVPQDGIVGVKTIQALNRCDQEDLFNKIVEERKLFLYDIVRRKPAQIRFFKGWINRLNDYKYSD
ncbi:MAG: glycosyl hydrolase 108 family protein [Bacteroidota bacterium]